MHHMISFYMSIEWMSTYLYVVKCPDFHMSYVYMELGLGLGFKVRVTMEILTQLLIISGI